MASETVAPEYERFVSQLRRDGQLPEPPHALDSGAVTDRIQVNPDEASRLLTTAALHAAGIYYSTRRTTIVWVEGDRELAINVAEMRLELHDGLIVVVIPVRCDQLDTVIPSKLTNFAGNVVTVTFAVGAPGRPAGLYAATERRPRGPELVISAWGESLVAFAWQCLLGLVSGLAGAVGKDSRGNILIPVELEASVDGLAIIPMARHRFSGSSGLNVTTTKAPVTGPIITGPVVSHPAATTPRTHPVTKNHVVPGTVVRNPR